MSAKRIGAGTVAALSVAVAMVGIAAPAEANPCGANKACGWIDGGFIGFPWTTTVSVSQFSATYNDKFTGVQNTRSTSITFWKDANYGGLGWTLSPGQSTDFSGNIVFNDAFSSVRL